MVRRARRRRPGHVLNRRTQVRVGLLALPLLALGVGLGCLAQPERTYFDDLLDGAVDGTSAPPGVDGSTVSDGEVPVGDDAGADAENGNDALSNADVVLPDGGPDAAPVEAGCGPTNTVANCGACGIACDTTHSSPLACAAAGACTYSACAAGWGDCDATAPNANGCESPLNTAANCSGCGLKCDTLHSVGAACTGTTCSYSACQPGWSMCKTTAPNTGGCACNTPMCCGANCAATHNDGLGQSWYDCVDAGTVDAATEAFKACTAYKDGSTSACSGGWTCPGKGPYVCDAPNAAQADLCSRCWSYTGSDIGSVVDCSCPSLRIGSWN
jgi:hypothetical protein